MEQLQVGQRIDIYKTLTLAGYESITCKVGAFRPGIKVENLSGVDIYVDRLSCGIPYIPLYFLPEECKKVGTIIIKSIKQPK